MSARVRTSRWTAVHLVRLALFALLLLLPAAGADGRTLGTPRAITTMASRGGVQLTMSVPQGAYARDTLTIVTVRIENHSGRELIIPRVPDACGNDDPRVEVSNGSGQVLYPPAIHAHLPSCNPTNTPVWRLPTGGALEKRLYIVVRGPRLRAVSMAAAANSPSPTTPIATPYYAIKLLAGAPPKVVIHQTPRLHANLIPAGSVAGPLLYQSTSLCPDGSGTALLRWRAARSNHVPAPSSPRCRHRAVWKAVAGWIGQPVASLHYKIP